MKLRLRLLLITGAAGLPLALTPPVSAQITSSSQVDHWGSYFGDKVKADADRQTSPVTITLPGTVAQLATSNSTEYALLTDGTVWAWGQGTNGELGNGSNANSFTTPVEVSFPPGVTIAFLPADAQPYDTGLAVDTAGHAWGWGLNLKGELCNGTTTATNIPVELPLPAPVTTLAGANSHAVYDAAGTVYACGSNYQGVLGTGKTTPSASTTPVQVQGLPAGVPVTELVSAYANAGALLANGQYYDWGYNAAGQLGNGKMTTAATPVPQLVSLPGAVAQVSQGGSDSMNGQTVVMLTDGAMFAWGNDAYSQLGDGKTTNEDMPVPLSPPPGHTYQTLASGGATCYAIDTAGNVWAWGRGNAGQIGNGSTAGSKTPVNVDGGATMINSTANNVAVAG